MDYYTWEEFCSFFLDFDSNFDPDLKLGKNKIDSILVLDSKSSNETYIGGDYLWNSNISKIFLSLEKKYLMYNNVLFKISILEKAFMVQVSFNVV